MITFIFLQISLLIKLHMNRTHPQKLFALSVPLPKQQTPSSPRADSPQKARLNEIHMLMWQLDSYTLNLESKVDGLLHRQELQFFQAYRSHLANLKKSFIILQSTVEAQRKKIEQYENEGELSKLIRKNITYQSQLNKMYATVKEKDKVIQELRIKLDALEKDNGYLHTSLKLMIKERTQQRLKNTQNSQQQSTQKLSPDTSNVFPTEIKDRHSDKTHQQSILNFLHNRQIVIQQQSRQKKSSISRRRTYYDAEYIKLQRQVAALKQRNIQLLKANVQSVNTHSQLQEFFLKCVNDIRKHICTRNGIQHCQFVDFLKEDKLRLLQMLLNNEQVSKTIFNLMLRQKLKTPPKATFQNSANKTVLQVPTVRNKSSSIALGAGVLPDPQQKVLPQISDFYIGQKKKKSLGRTNYLTSKRLSQYY